MFTLYVVATILTAAANFYAAYADFSRAAWIVPSMSRLGVPQSWLYPLGALKAAGATGVLVGMAMPSVGIAASIGLVLFFVGAITTAVRTRWYAHIPYPTAWLLLAVGSLVLRVLTL